jgi:hypothetical protein
MAKKSASTRSNKIGQRVQRGAGYMLISPTGRLFRARAIMREGKMLLIRLFRMP